MSEDWPFASYREERDFNTLETMYANATELYRLCDEHSETVFGLDARSYVASLRCDARYALEDAFRILCYSLPHVWRASCDAL